MSSLNAHSKQILDMDCSPIRKFSVKRIAMVNAAEQIKYTIPDLFI